MAQELDIIRSTQNNTRILHIRLGASQFPPLSPSCYFCGQKLTCLHWLWWSSATGGEIWKCSSIFKLSLVHLVHLHLHYCQSISPLNHLCLCTEWSLKSPVSFLTVYLHLWHTLCRCGRSHIDTLKSYTSKKLNLSSVDLISTASVIIKTMMIPLNILSKYLVLFDFKVYNCVCKVMIYKSLNLVSPSRDCVPFWVCFLQGILLFQGVFPFTRHFYLAHYRPKYKSL